MESDAKVSLSKVSIARIAGVLSLASQCRTRRRAHSPDSLMYSSGRVIMQMLSVGAVSGIFLWPTL